MTCWQNFCKAQISIHSFYSSMILAMIIVPWTKYLSHCTKISQVHKTSFLFVFRKLPLNCFWGSLGHLVFTWGFKSKSNYFWLITWNFCTMQNMKKEIIFNCFSWQSGYPHFNRESLNECNETFPQYLSANVEAVPYLPTKIEKKSFRCLFRWFFFLIIRKIFKEID